MLDRHFGSSIIFSMNRLDPEHRAQIIRLIVEGSSLRSTSRVADVSINTVTKLLVEAGTACAAYQDRAFRNLNLKRLQCDEIWSFVYAKQKNVTLKMLVEHGLAGDIWTWTAIDADTKLVPSWMIGGRDVETAKAFIRDLASRLRNRIQLTTDGHRVYLVAVEDVFGADIDYAMLVKIYGETEEAQKRYSPAECIATERLIVTGDPDPKHISTSYAERQNLTMRMCMRRFTRLTNGFSKKLENHVAAVSLYFMYYNFVRIHKTLRVSPAMAAGVTNHLWDFADIVALLEQKEKAA
jgi:IS1 family transposase